MNKDDWNFLLYYAELYPAPTPADFGRREIVVVRFRQWLREKRISHPGFHLPIQESEQ